LLDNLIKGITRGSDVVHWSMKNSEVNGGNLNSNGNAI
jgi:hypothetical protein